jgi:hypothetical protein
MMRGFLSESRRLPRNSESRYPVVAELFSALFIVRMVRERYGYICATRSRGMRRYRLCEFANTHNELASLAKNESVVLQLG